MANTALDQAGGPSASRVRNWVAGVLVTATLMFVAGILLAGMVDGVAQPWTGLTFVVGMGLALVVGLSKTSSA